MLPSHPPQNETLEVTLLLMNIQSLLRPQWGSFAVSASLCHPSGLGLDSTSPDVSQSEGVDLEATAGPCLGRHLRKCWAHFAVCTALGLITKSPGLIPESPGLTPKSPGLIPNLLG